LKGFRDYLPEQMILRQEIIGRFKHVFELHGFDPLDTPAMSASHCQNSRNRPRCGRSARQTGATWYRLNGSTISD
jgi:histidyl-tRNA synthetase